MVFSSIVFIFYYIPIVLFMYYISPKKFKNTVLLISSILFYFYGEPKYVLLMLLEIIITYIYGLLISKCSKKENLNNNINLSKTNKKAKFKFNEKKVHLITFLIIEISLLVYFKYINFLVININKIFSFQIDLVNVILPIGISFYTFQIISYIVDVYKGEVKVQKNIFTLATYITLFPQLIAGPIVRYKDIDEKLIKRTHTIENIALGIRRFVIGLGKKVLIANVLGQLVNICCNSNESSVLFYWLYAIANMLQIYFDFSGYSDMAIGLGKMFGFDFPENFKYPYCAISITEFWRRWHITLGSWFRDYVYIPLGGNRVPKIKFLRNIIIVWCLTGLWHGAAWNFIIWGIYFGVILIIEKELLLKINNKIPKFIWILYTCFSVMISFIIFSGESVEQITQNIIGLFGYKNIPMISNESIYYLKSYVIILGIAIIGATPLMKKICANNKINKIINIIEPIYLMAIFVLSTSYIIDGSFNPFLYFRF